MTARHREVLIAATLVAAACCRGRPDPLPGFPRVMLWAWERPERLKFIDPKAAGVAFLARTISWRSGQVTSRPRYQPLEVPPGTAMMAVVRMESDGKAFPDVGSIAREIVDTAALPGVAAIEIDFDARLSERGWYAGLVRRVRGRLPPGVPLTVTALASWCLGDPWIRGLPVDDAVPMLFRMGAGEPREVRDFSLEVCRSSLGISTDEVPFAAPHGRRLFVFHPRPWTPEAYRGAIELARRWR